MFRCRSPVRWEAEDPRASPALGDDALDLAVAFTTGEVFAFFTDLREAHGLWIRLPRGYTGPVTVSVWQGAAHPVCVGTHLVEGHSPPTHATLRTPGPCTLKWRWPGGPPRTLEAKGDSEMLLPRD